MARAGVLGVVVVLATFLAFNSSLSAGFTNWDDPVLVTQNATITSLSWSHWVTFFTTFMSKHYHPLVLVSYAVDYRFFGLDPFGFHLTNLAVHLVNTALVFWLFSTLSQNLAVGFVTAALFGFHPMHVESVAWISGRKDVLYTGFFWGALVSHTYYVRRRQRWLYCLCLGLFVLSLLSKSMAVTLPAVLVLLDWFLARKIDRSAIVEKLPHFALALTFAMIAMVAAHDPGARGLKASSFTWLGHIQSAFENLMFYVVKFVAPVNLAVIYPKPRGLGDVPTWLFRWSPLLLLLLGAAAYRGVRRSRPATFGLLFFLVTYLPVSQILPMALSIPADRYTYVPYVGLFFALVSLVEPNVVDQGKVRLRMAVTPLLALVLALSWWATFRRVKVWHDSLTLWQDSVTHQPVARAYHHLGWTYLADRGDLDHALALFSEATVRDPRLAVAWLDRGVVLARQGHYEEAIVSYGQAEKIEPAFIVYTNRANAYLAMGFPRAAIQDCSTALKLRPNDADAWYFRGSAYLLIRERDRAVADFTQALKLRDTFTVRNVRGNAYEAAGELSKAFDDFSAAIELQPGSPDGYYNRARIYSKTGRAAAALSDALRAKSLGMKISDEELARLRR